MDALNRHLLEDLTKLAHKFIAFPAFFSTNGAVPFVAYFGRGGNPASAQPVYFILLQRNQHGELWKKGCSSGECFMISRAAMGEIPDIFDAKTGIRTRISEFIFPSEQTPAVAVRRVPNGIGRFTFGCWDTL